MFKLSDEEKENIRWTKPSDLMDAATAKACYAIVDDLRKRAKVYRNEIKVIDACYHHYRSLRDTQAQLLEDLANGYEQSLKDEGIMRVEEAK